MAHGYSTILTNGLELPTINGTYNMMIENGEIFRRPTIVVETNVRSWIVSSMVLCMCPGCWILAVCGKVLGRKKVLISSVGLFLISWIILVFSSNVIHIFIARTLAGFSSGILMGLVSVYQGESTVPKLRATLNAVHSVCFALGILLSHALGTWFHWRTVAFFAAFISFITLFLNHYVPESPIWLMRKRRFRKAIQSWTYLRGIRDLDELKSMHVDILNDFSEKKNKKKQFSNTFFSPGFLKPLSIMFAIFTVSQMSGLGVIIHYCIQIITGIAGPERAYIPTLIVDSFRFVSSIAMSILTDRYGIRTMILFSTFSTSFFLILLSLALLFNLWVPLSALMLLFAYEIVVVLGLSSLPWAFCSELFSGSYKEIGVGLSTSYNFLLFFIILKIKTDLFTTLQPWGAFLLFGIFTAVGLIILYFILPETRNKTLNEIELMFLKK